METANNRKISTEFPLYPIKDLLEEYKFDLEAANRSPKYIEWLLENLSSFFCYLESFNIRKTVTEIGAAELNNYIHYLRNRNRWPNRQSDSKDYGKLSPSSIAGHIRAIKAFWSWLAREGYVKKNPIARFPSYKVPQYIIRTLNNDQINKLLSTIDKSIPVGYRYYCIFLILLDTGMRISELVGIKIKDIDMPQGLIRIFGKGQKERIVPFSRHTKKVINHYIANYRLRLDTDESPYLFPADYRHISVGSVQQYMRRLAKKIALDGIRLSPHTFRHTCATLMISRGANVYTVKNILGHSSLQTTLKYTHLQPEDIKSQHNRFSPVGCLVSKT